MSQSVSELQACEARTSSGLSPLQTEPHVAVQSLAVRRGSRTLVSGLNLSIARGKFIAVAGPSGIGKSSLLYCLAGLLKPDGGDITFRCQGGCEHEPAGYRQRVGFIHQDLRLVQNSTLLENVLCGRLGHIPWWKSAFGFSKTDKQRALQLMSELGIAQYAHRAAADVSGGEQQRAAIVRAILQDPEIFLADEPVAHLDFSSARKAMDLLKRLTRTANKTVFCTLHDPQLVAEYADLVLRLHATGDAQWTFEEPGR
jgi:phosphonate transport system ATP-binding protein